MKVRQRFFWFNEAHDRPLPERAIVVDGFAGGGGASLGLHRAIGRSPDVAINHDQAAIAMHMSNHPETKHYCENIWDVDPREVCEGRPVAAAWFSPDCTHFSRARGEKPVSKNIRGLAGVVVRWARLVKPDVIFIENVDEFQTWGPVDETTNQPVKEKAGTLFLQWVRSLRRCGYRVEWRSLTASDYGTPTTRRRLFIVARRDGRPIVWPEPTHGGPRQIQRDLDERGRCNRRPWRTAAEIVDWSIPCPSIFLSPAEARAVGCRRPLAEKTLRRIAEGIRRYVIEAADPFIVRVNHGSQHFRGQSLNRPLGTVTTSNGYGLVTPFLSSAAYSRSTGRGKYIYDPREPVRTVTTSNDKIVVVPQLMSYYGERPGQRGRGRLIDSPVPTVTTENRFALVAAFVAKHFGGMVGKEARHPFPTVTTRGTQNQIVAAHVTKMNFGVKPCTGVDEPLHTIVTAKTHALTTSHLLKLRGTSRAGGPLDRPVDTLTAGGNHFAEVRAFLMSYYGNGSSTSPRRPVPTITTRDRLALGIVLVGGEPYQIVDVGMRMLTPRELFNAQGFPSDYAIDVGLNGKPATKSEQVARCGNSVCPQVVAALVAANRPESLSRRPTRREVAA